MRPLEWGVGSFANPGQFQRLNPRTTAWRPSLNAVPHGGIARGPGFRCFSNAASYRCDKANNLRFIIPAGLTRRYLSGDGDGSAIADA